MKPIVTNALAISLIALSLSFTQLAYAGLDEGFTAYEKADFKTALKEWKPLAEQLPYAHIFFMLVKPFLPSSNLAECWQNPLVR